MRGAGPSLGAKFVSIDIGESGETAQGYARELTPEQIEMQRQGMKQVIVGFVFGLKMLGSPDTARRGNALSAAGMLIAIVVTLLSRGIVEFHWIAIPLPQWRAPSSGRWQRAWLR